MDREQRDREWPIPIGTVRFGADVLHRDDPVLGRAFPYRPAHTTAELAAENCRTNRAIAAAERAELVHDGGKTKLLLVYDPDVANRLSLRKPRDWKRIPRSQDSTSP